MEERYLRNLDSLSVKDMERLKSASVFVAGCGGLGGYVIDMLLRIGVGRISCADGDVFDVTNLNRQLLSDTTVLGKNKAYAAQAYAKKVNPSCRFFGHPGYIDEENAAQLIEGCDAAIDALDSIPARKLLKAASDRTGIPYIYGAVGGWQAQAAIVLPGDSLLENLYQNDVFCVSTDTVPSVLCFSAACCAAMQVSLCTSWLCSKDITPGKLYCVDLQSMSFLDI